MYTENEELDSELRWREAVERQALKRNFEYPWNVVEIEELSKCGVWTETMDSAESFENLNSSQHYGDLETYLRSEDVSSLQEKANRSFLEPTFYTPLKPQEAQKRIDKENFPFKSQLTPKAKKVVIPPLEVKQKTVSPQTAHVTTATFRNLEGIRESKKALDTTVSRSKPPAMYECTESVPLVNFDVPPIDCSLSAQKPEGLEDDLRTRKNMYDTDVKQLYAGLDQFLSGVNQIREDLKSIEKESKQRLRRIGSRSYIRSKPIDLAARIRSKSHHNLKSNKSLYGSFLVSSSSLVDTSRREPLATQLQSLHTSFQSLKGELGPLRREVIEMRSAVGSFSASSDHVLAGLTADLQSDIQANFSALEQANSKEASLGDSLNREIKSLTTDIRHVRKAIRQFGARITKLEEFIGVNKARK